MTGLLSEKEIEKYLGALADFYKKKGMSPEIIKETIEDTGSWLKYGLRSGTTKDGVEHYLREIKKDYSRTRRMFDYRRKIDIYFNRTKGAQNRAIKRYNLAKKTIETIKKRRRRIKNQNQYFNRTKAILKSAIERKRIANKTLLTINRKKRRMK